jgi:glycosyltransferase involved in cell wall biosynthesis
MPFFSIIIPTYNRAHFIGSAIESVIQQTFYDWELIVIDDGSTDHTEKVVKSFIDNRMKYFYQQNVERSSARNNGILKTTGQFICFLDSDDIWLPNHLQTVLEAVRENKFKPAMYFTIVRWCFDTGIKRDAIFESPKNKNLVEYVIKNQIAPSTVCVHQEILVKHRFNTSLQVNEDVELNTRIVKEYPLVQIPVVTVEMRVHEENTKALFKEYITPQVKAMELIFSNPDLKDEISNQFKKKVFQTLHRQYINVWKDLGEIGKMNRAILFFLYHYPLDHKNKEYFVLLLYHLPFGKYIKGTIKLFKSMVGKA